MKKVLITGSAGFIGFHLAERLLSDNVEVIGLDNFNDYYSVDLKVARSKILEAHKSFTLVRADLENKSMLTELLASHSIDTIYHLGAQAGVRYSLEKPEVYISSNVTGTLNVLEAARFTSHKPHLIMASSSSVYGLTNKFPLREDDAADRTASLYGVTKRADEMMGHVYSHLFGLRVTMLRFFTVYGPWGRPDMALFKFVKAIMDDEEIELYNNGDMIRDFTYVDDVVDGMLSLNDERRAKDLPLYDVFNIGCSEPRTLIEFVHAIEAAIGKKAKIKSMPFQAGDIYKTFADVSKLNKLCGYAPKTKIEEGVKRFVQWYREFYG